MGHILRVVRGYCKDILRSIMVMILDYLGVLLGLFVDALGNVTEIL